MSLSTKLTDSTPPGAPRGLRGKLRRMGIYKRMAKILEIYRSRQWAREILWGWLWTWKRRCREEEKMMRACLLRRFWSQVRTPVSTCFLRRMWSQAYQVDLRVEPKVELRARLIGVNSQWIEMW